MTPTLAAHPSKNPAVPTKNSTSSRLCLATSLLALFVFAGCKAPETTEEAPRTRATATTSKPVSRQNTSKGSKSEAQPQCNSSPSGISTAQRLKDLEKGLRRLQSLPSEKIKRRARNRLDL
jgi:hypothetical protein